MATMAEITTDKRVDDLRAEMHRGFDQMETDTRELRADTKAGFAAMNARFDSVEGRFDSRFDSMNDRFDSMNARFDSMQKLMIGFFATTVGSVIAAVAAKILLHF